MDPALAADADLPRRVAIFELDLDALAAAAPAVVQAEAVYIYPAATQDLSLVVDRNLAAGQVLKAIYQGAGELLEHATLVDDYRGENVGEDKKSLTFALRFRAADRTLTQVEASESRDAAVALAADLFGAVIRA